MTGVRYTAHAREQMDRYAVAEAEVQTILAGPDQVVAGRYEREIYQSRQTVGDRVYLIRVIVEHETDTRVVITVNRTSKVSKYWRID